MIVDHFPRLKKLTAEERVTKIEENFPDEQLFQVSVQLPWYADIVSLWNHTTRFQLPVEKKAKNLYQSIYMG